MEYRETPLCFDCAGASLVGVLTTPAEPARIAVIIVVGGPQYRVGSHRQFVLLARALAAAGIACLRFDYRGMGDSEGDVVAFDAIGPDIAAALAALRRRLPQTQAIALWGLCDGAAACALVSDAGAAAGLILVNPWVRTDAGFAASTLSHYYARRIGQRDFWRKLRSGSVEFGASARALLGTLARVVRARFEASGASEALPERVARGIADHPGPVLVMLSGNDQTAAEFALAAAQSAALQAALQRPGVSRIDIADADHTLSSERWRNEAAALTIEWLRRHFAPVPSGDLQGKVR